VDIRCCRGSFKAECAPRLCRRRRRRAPNPCVALPRWTHREHAARGWAEL